VKIYTRPISTYRKVELRCVLLNTALGTAVSTLKKTEAIITLSQANYKIRNHDKYEL